MQLNPVLVEEKKRAGQRLVAMLRRQNFLFDSSDAVELIDCVAPVLCCKMTHITICV